MDVKLKNEELEKISDEITERVLEKVKTRLKEETIGKVIGIKEFNRKYVKKTPNWIKQYIFYEFKPDWVENIYPGKGTAFRIHEHDAAKWMEEHRHQIDWEAKEL